MYTFGIWRVASFIVKRAKTHEMPQYHNIFTIKEPRYTRRKLHLITSGTYIYTFCSRVYDNRIFHIMKKLKVIILHPSKVEDFQTNTIEIVETMLIKNYMSDSIFHVVVLYWDKR